MDIKTKKTAKYLIHLLNSVLKDTRPMEKPEDISFGELYSLAKFHNVQCMSYYAIEKLEGQPQQEQNRKWRSERDQHIVTSMIQLAERDSIIDSLTGAGIDVLPLKGCLLKEMYPQVDYRAMCDLDILIDSSKANLARQQMKSLEYITKKSGSWNHDNYEKPPYMGVELHKSMISKRYDNQKYYKDVWSKAILDNGREHCFHFSWDDYYVFMLVHFANHYYSNGSGIRSIMDIYVFLNEHREELNQEYLDQELLALDFAEFRKDAEDLAEYWFGDGHSTSKIEEMANYIITSGVGGTYQRGVENRIKRAEQKSKTVWGGKIRYLFSRIFLKREKMCDFYPIVNKIPILLPVCWILRGVSAVVHSRDLVGMELNGIFKRRTGKKE